MLWGAPVKLSLLPPLHMLLSDCMENSTEHTFILKYQLSLRWPSSFLSRHHKAQWLLLCFSWTGPVYQSEIVCSLADMVVVEERSSKRFPFSLYAHPVGSHYHNKHHNQCCACWCHKACISLQLNPSQVEQFTAFQAACCAWCQHCFPLLVCCYGSNLISIPHNVRHMGFSISLLDYLDICYNYSYCKSSCHHNEGENYNETSSKKLGGTKEQTTPPRDAASQNVKSPWMPSEPANENKCR